MKLHSLSLQLCDWMSSLENCAKILLTNEVGKCDKEEEENELAASTLECTFILRIKIKIQNDLALNPLPHSILKWDDILTGPLQALSRFKTGQNNVPRNGICRESKSM